MRRMLSLALLVLGWQAGVAFAQEGGFRPIFDGESLSGWKPWEGEEKHWRVENGTIIGESTPENPCARNSFLVWEHGEVDDFELRLKFRISGDGSANSGIQFRSKLRSDGHVIGYQADIDRAGNWLGALYDEALRGVLAKRGQKVTLTAEKEQWQTEQVADAAELWQHVKIDDWNDYTITARGKHIVLKVNGHVTAEIFDNDPKGLDRQGVLALQLHSGPPMKIEFRDIHLKRLPLEEGWKKVVFIAGTPSHGYFSHEHNAGCKLLARKLVEAGMSVVPVVYTNGWPKDPTAFDNADTVVSYCDGGGRHYLNNNLDLFQALVDERGIGLVCIHYAVETVTGPPGEHFLKWIGGFFEPHWSVNPHWTANFKNLPEHPITNGVQPFEINDEWYYHMRFVPEMKGVTPILTDLPPRETLTRPDGPHSGNPHVREAILVRQEPQHVAWAYERPDDKGRGFGFTGGHFHRNWGDDNFRKIVLNAILWTAHAEVPAEGVNSPTPTQEELEENQDFPKPEERRQSQNTQPQNRQPRVLQQVSVASVAGNATSKPLVSSKIITTKTPGHGEELEANIGGARKLFLVVTDGGDGFSCDWANWAEPRLIGDNVEKKLTDLKWVAAASDWGSVNVNQNAEGGPLRIAGKPVAYGIGTHANSVIEFDLPENHPYTTFKVFGGLDNGGTDQGGGGSTSVQFHLFTQRPGAAFIARNSGAAGSVAGMSHEPADAVDQLTTHESLQATLFASEPMFSNPASIDIDHLGRVWVCEAINYRAFRNADIIGERKEGDRILVLEDTNGNGTADKSTIFYQGHDVDSAHGILILPTEDGKGLRALVSALDAVFFLIDDDGDLKADRKEFLFTGIDGSQHDHGIHAVHFGPDGKLYFNFGNVGRHIKDKEGKPIIDMAGNAVNDSRKPYQEGMVFRCNLDGSQFETLGWNFRNNWEACVDPFGTIWQSDNDDDGNRGVRINYVMEFGNYGYRQELTGAGWREYRTGWEEDIPSRHWHQNDPGVIPNLLQTGAGSPTGITFYEGELLPAPFRGAMLHCDAGPNICRAYIPTRAGAGYTAEIVDILEGTGNKWYRPSDVCVAPDGSIMIADWYDPGVGGHRMQDAQRGRLFRIVPANSDLTNQYVAPELDLSTPAGAIRELVSPNMSRRYLGWTAVMAMGDRALPALREQLQSSNPFHQARALWAIGKLNISPDTRRDFIREAMQDQGNLDLQITAVRLARQLLEIIPADAYDGAIDLDALQPAMARELLIAIRAHDLDNADALWGGLAARHDGQDRWYLEALGIAAEGRWDAYLTRWFEFGGDIHTKAGRDIIWRSRSSSTPKFLAELIRHPSTPADELPRLFRAFDFQSSDAKNPLLLELAFKPIPSRNAEQQRFIQTEALNRLDGIDLTQQPAYLAALNQTLEQSQGDSQYVKLVDKFRVTERYASLLELAQAQPESQLAVDAIAALYRRGQQGMIQAALQHENRETVESTLAALTTAASNQSNGLLMKLVRDEQQPLSTRRGAVKALGASQSGAKALLELAQKQEYPAQLKEALAATLTTSSFKEITDLAVQLFPPPPGKEDKPLPSITQLLSMQGDVANGRVIFNTTGTCNKCHQVNGIGQEIGPDLSEIGKKLTPTALYESILYPSAGISHNYETWLVITEEGESLNGLLVSESDSEIKLKDAKGLIRTIPATQVEAKKKLDISLMPADLQKLMTAQELVDVVDYMQTLKEKR